MQVKLKNVPTDVTAATVSLSTIYEAMDFGGNLSGQASATLDLTKQMDGIWQTEVCYLMPTTANLTLSIGITIPNGKQTYGYTHSSTLKGNAPYTLAGSYRSGFAVNGSIVLAGWNEPKEINFVFGAGESEKPDNPITPENPEDTDGIYTVSAIPQAGKLWNNHFVAALQDVTATSAELILLSTTEWTGITSATHEVSSQMATNLVNSYAEESITGWNIPTRNEAKLMRSTIGLDALMATNRVLQANGVTTIDSGEDEEGTKVRYLCDDATYSFVWDGTSLAKCGAKRTYNLRAVKRVQVIIK